MARINTISDGQPFTYQLLNSIIEAINDIKNPEGNDEEGDITIVGPGRGTSERPLIVFDRTTITIPENQTAANGKAQFRTGFINQNPVVVATLVDPEAGGATPIGYLTVTSVSDKNFEYRVKLIRKREKSTTVEINYIAIGGEPK